MIVGSPIGLVMWIAHERRPLALVSSNKKFVAALVIVTSSQADSVYFFVTKPVGEPMNEAKTRMFRREIARSTLAKQDVFGSIIEETGIVPRDNLGAPEQEAKEKVPHKGSSTQLPPDQ